MVLEVGRLIDSAIPIPTAQIAFHTQQVHLVLLLLLRLLLLLMLLLMLMLLLLLLLG